MKYSDISDVSSITRLTLSVSDEGSGGAYNTTVYAKQNDTLSRYIEAEIKSGDKVLDIPNTAVARIRCTKPDGKSVINDGCVHNGKIYVEISAQMLASPGIVKADIGIYNGESVLSTASFDIEVIRTPFDESRVYSDNEFSALTTALSTADNIYKTEAELKDARTDIDGKTHESAGEAVRKQIFSVKNELDTVIRISNTVQGEIISVSDAAAPKMQELKLYGTTAQNGEPSVNAPAAITGAVRSGTVRTTVHNKNLLSWPYRRMQSGNPYVNGGVTFTANDDGSITFSGTNTGTSSENAEYALTGDGQIWLPAGTYTLSTGAPEDDTRSWYLTASLYAPADNTSVFAYGGSRQLVVTDPGYVFIGLRVMSGKTVDNVTIYPQLEIGSDNTDYVKPTELQTITTQVPDGLYGVPVSFGGNYTDENGQQWVCDEIDFARGKYIQRIGRITLDGHSAMGKETTDLGYQQFYKSLKSMGLADGKGSTSPILCNYLPYGRSGYGCAFISDAGYFILRPNEAMQNLTADELTALQTETPTQAVYILALPVETDLTAEEIAAYKALQLSTPSAVIISNEPVGEGLTYAVRTDSYVEKRSSAASARVLSGILPDEMKAYREDSLGCIASYLVYQAGSTCVVGTPQLDENIPMFFPVYSVDKGYENLFYDKHDFVFTDTAEFDGAEYPTFYGDCETFVSLLTKCIRYEESAYSCGFKNPNASAEELLPYAVESGGPFDKPYTFDYRNLYVHGVDKPAYASNKMGNPLHTVCRMNNGSVIWDESVFDMMETGDIMFCGYTEGREERYKHIGHIMYFIKSLDDLNKYGEQYGVTFRTILKDRGVGNGRHGYIAEISDATINGADVIRIRSLDRVSEVRSSNGELFHDAFYVQKPQSNIFTSTKAYEKVKGLLGELGTEAVE